MTRPSLRLLHGANQPVPEPWPRPRLRLIRDDASGDGQARPLVSDHAAAQRLLDQLACDEIAETVAVLAASASQVADSAVLRDLTGALASTLARQITLTHSERTRWYLKLTSLDSLIDEPSLIDGAGQDPFGDGDDAVAFFVCTADMVECLLLSELARYGTLTEDDVYRLADEAYGPCVADRAAELAMRGGEPLVRALTGERYLSLAARCGGQVSALITASMWRQALAAAIPEPGEIPARGGMRVTHRGALRAAVLGGELADLVDASLVA